MPGSKLKIGKDGHPEGKRVENKRSHENYVADEGEWVLLPSAHGANASAKSAELDRRQYLLDTSKDDSLEAVKDKIEEAKRAALDDANQLRAQMEQRNELEEAKNDLDHLSKQEFTLHYLQTVFGLNSERNGVRRDILRTFGLEYPMLELNDAEFRDLDIRKKYVEFFCKLVDVKYKSLSLTPVFSNENTSQKERELIGKMIFFLEHDVRLSKETLYASINEILDEARKDLKTNVRYSQILLWAVHYRMTMGVGHEVQPFPLVARAVEAAEGAAARPIGIAAFAGTAASGAVATTARAVAGSIKLAVEPPIAAAAALASAAGGGGSVSRRVATLERSSKRT